MTDEHPPPEDDELDDAATDEGYRDAAEERAYEQGQDRPAEPEPEDDGPQVS